MRTSLTGSIYTGRSKMPITPLYHTQHGQRFNLASYVEYPRGVDREGRAPHMHESAWLWREGFEMSRYGIIVTDSVWATEDPLANIRAALEKRRELFGDDFWPYKELIEDGQPLGIQPFLFQLQEGLWDASWQCLSHDAYLTLRVLDNWAIREDPEHKPFHIYYIDLAWHDRQLHELREKHAQELAAVRRQVIEEILGERKDDNLVRRIAKQVEDAAAKAVEAGVQRAIAEGTATLEQIRSERARLEKQLAALKEAEARELEREAARLAAEAEKARRKAEYDPSGYVYLILNAQDGIYKVGKSKEPRKRLSQLQTSTAGALTLVHVIPAADADALEGEWHDRFRARHVRGEWYALSEDDVNEFTNGTPNRGVIQEND